MIDFRKHEQDLDVVLELIETWFRKRRIPHTWNLHLSTWFQDEDDRRTYSVGLYDAVSDRWHFHSGHHQSLAQGLVALGEKVSGKPQTPRYGLDVVLGPIEVWLEEREPYHWNLHVGSCPNAETFYAVFWNHVTGERRFWQQEGIYSSMAQALIALTEAVVAEEEKETAAHGIA